MIRSLWILGLLAMASCDSASEEGGSPIRTPTIGASVGDFNDRLGKGRDALINDQIEAMASKRFKMMPWREWQKRRSASMEAIPGVDFVFRGNLLKFDVTPVSGTQEVAVQVALEMKLVEAVRGAVVANASVELTRQDPKSTWGLRDPAQIDNESASKILRWALEEAYRKMAPAMDAKFGK